MGIDLNLDRVERDFEYGKSKIRIICWSLDIVHLGHSFPIQLHIAVSDIQIYSQGKWATSLLAVCVEFWASINQQFRQCV